jgi:hypothetical protein
MNDGKYCIMCGKEQVAKPTGCFDSNTGKSQFAMQCVNPNCSQGEGHTHQFGWGSTCKTCGFVSD